MRDVLQNPSDGDLFSILSLLFILLRSFLFHLYSIFCLLFFFVVLNGRGSIIGR